MPIRGLDARARLPRLGVIRLGVKVQNGAGKEYPKEVDYFVVPDDVKEAIGEAKPTRLKVLFPTNNVDLLMPADYVRYDGKLLGLKCDGERYTEIPKSGREVVGNCRRVAGQGCECKAKALARLSVILLDGPMGVYQVLIGGEQRIADLLTELRMFAIRPGLTNAAYVLERVPTEVQVRKESGERLARTGWPVHVRCEFTAAQALRASQVDLKALPGAEILDEDDETAATDGHDDVPALGTTTTAVEVTLQRCEALAQELGMTIGDYRTYLALTYKTSAAAVSAEHLAEQCAALLAAKSDPKVSAQLVAAMRARVRHAERESR